MRAEPSDDAPLIERLREGAVLANQGCRIAADRGWCHVRPLRGGPGGYVEADALRPARGPDGVIPMGEDDSATRAGKGSFDAQGEVPCAQEQGQAMGKCTIGVARSGGGDATALVRFHNGFSRLLHFVHGEFMRANTTMSGNGTDTDWRIESGIHVVRVDDQRYELADDLIFGE